MAAGLYQKKTVLQMSAVGVDATDMLKDMVRLPRKSGLLRQANCDVEEARHGAHLSGDFLSACLGV